MKNTVRAKWADYLQSVMPASASEIQINEGKLNFYAGFMAAYCVMTQEVTAMPDDQAVLTMTALGEELAEFTSKFSATGRVP